MVDRTHLETLWQSIVPDADSPYHYKRISADSESELCVGLSNDSHRCLMLELPRKSAPNIRSVERENLTLTIWDQSILVLELTSASFQSIFSDLVLSLYFAINAEEDPGLCASTFIETFYKWSEFFCDSSDDRLSDNSVMGFIGELVVLDRFLGGCDLDQIDRYLQSWKGPYDKGKDFELESLDIEVKSKSIAKSSVSIASEYQLDPAKGKGLELWIVGLQPSPDGVALSGMVVAIKQKIVSGLGDLSIFLRALRQKNVTLKNCCEYDSVRFLPKYISRYDAKLDGFPALKRSALSDAVSRVRYDLAISEIDGYMVEEIEL